MTWRWSTSPASSAEQARLERRYGYVFQAPALFPWRTIEKNLKLPLEVMGFSDSEQRQRAPHDLALVNLPGFERRAGAAGAPIWLRVPGARAVSMAHHREEPEAT